MPEHLQVPKRRAMTPDEVLGLFHQWSMIEYWFTLDEAKARLSRDASISKLRAEIDYLGDWKVLGESLNEIFDIDVPTAGWAPYLRRRRRCTVGDLCDFIARHAMIEEFQPAEILGRTCLEAGVFRTIVSMLKRAGADASNLAPSTRVRPYIRDYSAVFFWDLGKIAPGAIPKFEGMDHNLVKRSIIRDMVVLLYMSLPVVGSVSLLLSFLWPPLLTVAGGAMFLVVFPLLCGIIWSALTKGRRSENEDGRTFKQLCYAVAHTMRTATSESHPDPDGIGTGHPCG